VDVTVTQTTTGLTRSVVTDDTGSFTLPNLPVGPSRLEVALSGFRIYVQTGIVLQVNSNPTFNVELSLGELTETVSVEASAPLIQSRPVTSTRGTSTTTTAAATRIAVTCST
jgi:hypothetical protein